MPEIKPTQTRIINTFVDINDGGQRFGCDEC